MEVTRHEGKKDELNEVLYWIHEYYGLHVPQDVQLSVAEKMDIPLSMLKSAFSRSIL